MPTTFHFRVLDASVRLSGPEDLLAPVVRAYRRFVADDDAANGTHEIRVDSAGSFLDGTERVPFISGVDPTLQLYERFLTAVFDRVEAFVVLHAGALVDANGDVLLIAGPSGFGKTSLTLELLRRGLRFLSDDYAPIELSSGRVRPYPRTIGLLPGGSARTPPEFSRAAADPGIPRMLGKALIAVGEVLGESAVAAKSAPVKNVVCLDVGENDPAYHSVVHVGVWPAGVGQAEKLVAEIPGVAVLRRDDRADITLWELELSEDDLATRRFSQLLEREWVAFSETRPSTGPSFRSTPRLLPLRRREVALRLCREAQNRRPRGRLMRAYGGDTTRLFLDVASALASAGCYRLQVGGFDSTADLLEGLCDPGVGDATR